MVECVNGLVTRGLDSIILDEKGTTSVEPTKWWKRTVNNVRHTKQLNAIGGSAQICTTVTPLARNPKIKR